jgi:dUTP pyrophosphatase
LTDIFLDDKIKERNCEKEKTMKIAVKKVLPGAQLPTYGSEFSAGADLYALLDEPCTIAPGETVLLHTGIAMEIPEGYGGFIYARSGLGVKKGLAPANKVGVIDSDYRGEVMVALHNHSLMAQTVAPGERVAQLLITPVYTPGFRTVDELDDTARGTGGFGSTGK